MARNTITLEAAALSFGGKVSQGDLPKVVERSILKAESKNTGMKYDFGDAIKHSSIVSNIVVKRYKGLMSNGTRQSAKYLEEIESTMGRYTMHRDKEVRMATRSVYELITTSMDVKKRNSGPKEFGTTPYSVEKPRYVYTVLDVYVRLYKLVCENTSWAHSFAMAYDSHAKGVAAGSMVYIQYLSLVFTMEKMALMLMGYSKQIEKGLHSTMHEDFSKKYVAFTSYNLASVIPILVNCESTKAPENYVKQVIKLGLNSKSTESEKYLIDKAGLNGNTISEEFGAALLYGAATILIAVTMVHALRYMIYSFSCLTVDISKSLKDQAYTVLMGMEALLIEQSRYKEGDKEYKRIGNILKKQADMAVILMKVTDALAGEDMKSPDEIRKKEREDNEEIDDEEDTGTNGGGLDI